MNIVEMPQIGTQTIQVPDTIVIHAMAEYIDTEPFDMSAYDLLRGMGLSAHFLVTPSGLSLKCCGEQRMCYHAKGHNMNSIGIEILVPGLHTYATFAARIMDTKWCYHQAQWDEAVALVRYLMDAWDISPGCVVRHSELSPGRKVDPGEGFEWQAFRKEIGPMGA